MYNQIISDRQGGSLISPKSILVTDDRRLYERKVLTKVVRLTSQRSLDVVHKRFGDLGGICL